MKAAAAIRELSDKISLDPLFSLSCCNINVEPAEEELGEEKMSTVLLVLVALDDICVVEPTSDVFIEDAPELELTNRDDSDPSVSVEKGICEERGQNVVYTVEKSLTVCGITVAVCG